MTAQTVNSVSTAPVPGDAILELRDVTKVYGSEVNALRGVTLRIADGEFVTLLGPSGAGKTTLLMVIAGFERPTSGRVLSRGTDITDQPPERRNLGIVFQSYALFPNMTVSQNVSYPLRIRRIERAQRERMVDAALALVDLEGYGRRRPSQLSGGQQQRVALARALVYKPSVLLLDEPLGALDRALRERVQGELRSLHRKVGTTFVHITHDQDEALTMSDRVVVLRDGRIEQVGTPHEIYAQPATQFVASFIGRANLIPAEVVQSRSGTVIVDLASGIRVEVPCDADTSFGPTANIIIRPEKVSPVAEPKAGMCVLVGRLVEETFAGSMWRYAFRAADGSTFHSQTAQRIKGPIGEEVCVEWSPTDAWAIPGLTAPDAAPSP